MRVYAKTRDTKPSQKTLGGSRPDNKKWLAQVQQESQVATVINGCMIPWTNPWGPWNIGYIKDFWEKIDNGENWDKPIERKAGGVKVTEAITIEQCTRCLSSLSSVMSLIRATVGQFQRTNTVDEQLLSIFQFVLFGFWNPVSMRSVS